MEESRLLYGGGDQPAIREIEPLWSFQRVLYVRWRQSKNHFGSIQEASINKTLDVADMPAAELTYNMAEPNIYGELKLAWAKKRKYMCVSSLYIYLHIYSYIYLSAQHLPHPTQNRPRSAQKSPRNSACADDSLLNCGAYPWNDQSPPKVPSLPR